MKSRKIVRATFTPGAVDSYEASFRQHARNTSASNFNKLYYYEELWRLLNHHVAMWGIPAETRQKLQSPSRYIYFGRYPRGP